MIIDNKLIKIASFSPRVLHTPHSWVGHLPFARWIIEEMHPKVFVELGTHTGNSYFSFCQSVNETGISTQCYAVDTWEGDAHAGYYDNKIFNSVYAYHQQHYTNFSQLLRMTFDEALSHFEDNSIDLLHIDGCHTYEAVRHDFETWLPKLAPGAVVLFHDTNVYERNFGVWKLWKELQSCYLSNIEFFHSHGLGVIQLNNAPEEKRLSFLNTTQENKNTIINYFAALGEHQQERCALSLAGTKLSATEAQLSATTNNLTELMNSSSWRITLPIRKIKRLLTTPKKKINRYANMIKLKTNI